MKKQLGVDLVKRIMGETRNDLLKTASKLLTKYAIPTKDAVTFLKPQFPGYTVLIDYIVKLVNSAKPKRFFHDFYKNTAKKLGKQKGLEIR